MTHPSVLWPKKRIVALGLLVVVIHALLLFFIIPMVSARLAPSYNQERLSDGYDLLAENLLAGNGYRFYPDTARTLMREPGYPILIAGLFFVFGKSFVVIKIANMVMALCTAWLMMRMAMKLSIDAPSRRALLVIIPPILFLFHPGTLMAESRGGTEIVFSLLVTLFLLAVCQALETNRWWNFAVSGLVLGITVSFRSTPILFPLFLFGYILLFERARVSKLATCRNISVMLVAMLAVLSPWIVRNYSLTGKFVPTGSVLGVSAQAGQYINQHLFEGKPWWLLDREAARKRDRLAEELGFPFEDGKDGYYQTFYNSQDEVSFSKYLFGKVVSEYRASPLLFVRSVCQNAFNFWFAGKTWTATLANFVLQFPFLVLGVIGSVIGLKNREARVVGLLLLFMGYIMAVHLPILAQARYSMPLIPFLSILASIALVAAQARINNSGIFQRESTHSMEAIK